MSFQIICFDCDSTLSKIEGIDELAKRKGLGDELAKLTDAAMNGIVPLESVYKQRLDLIKPDRNSIEWLADLYISEQVDGVATVFSELIAQGKQLHIISGGLRQAILPLAYRLGLTDQQVHAVDVYFNDDGSYLDYQQQSPLARNGGKAEICRQLMAIDSNLAMIGDGNTDLEAMQAGAFMIGFGGVVERAIVRERANAYCSDSNLMSIMSLLQTRQPA